MFQVCLRETPVGPLMISGTDQGLEQIRLNCQISDVPALCPQHPLAVLSVEQLQAWFAGRLRQFHLPLTPRGTDFQQQVWQALRQIPWGTTASYAQIAAAIGRPRACRAVGLANGRNPLPIIIPCHRVIGSSGQLVGYSAGLHIKRILLTLENSPLP
ncbi:MAG: methylated-DNA--[protein]-cysteine S-methyltransferase [Planctomycetaceae bacterium]